MKTFYGKILSKIENGEKDEFNEYIFGKLQLLLRSQPVCGLRSLEF